MDPSVSSGREAPELQWRWWALIGLVILGPALVLVTLSTPNVSERTPPPVRHEEMRFTGIVEQAMFGCTHDAACHLVVSGTGVTFGQGWVAGPWGTVEPGADSVGRKVRVYCRKDFDG